MRLTYVAVLSVALAAPFSAGCGKDDESNSGAFMDSTDDSGEAGTAADSADGGTGANTSGETDTITDSDSATTDPGMDLPAGGESSGNDSSGNPGCGDGVITPPEQCDGNDLDGYTCETLGYTGGGTLACDPVTCTLDTSNCIPGSGNTASTSGI